jgi:UDP-glucose 4-epimerase
MSSIAVYGVENGTIDEQTPCNPLNDYGKSKLEAEQELLKLEDDTFKISIIRPPLVYGFNAPGNMRSLVNLVRKVPVLPFGKIKNRRSMIYVGNLSFFIDAIIEKQASGIFLVADEKPLSTTRLIELIAEALDKQVYLIRVPFFEGLLKLLKPSFHKRLFESLELDNQDTMKRLFGKTGVLLPFSVEDGIRLMIEGKQK